MSIRDPGESAPDTKQDFSITKGLPVSSELRQQAVLVSPTVQTMVRGGGQTAADATAGSSGWATVQVWPHSHCSMLASA